MIEGMVILTQTEITHIAPLGLVLLILGIIVFFVTCLGVDDFPYLALPGLILAAVICVGGIMQQTGTGRYEYQCTFDETVSITEIYEKYEAVKVQDKLWTLRDKEIE